MQRGTDLGHLRKKVKGKTKNNIVKDYWEGGGSNGLNRMERSCGGLVCHTVPDR